MAQVYRCERCGGIYDKAPKAMDKDGVSYCIQVTRDLCGFSPIIKLDLCEKCTGLLNDFMSNLTVYGSNSPGIELPEKKKKSWFGRRK